MGRKRIGGGLLAFVGIAVPAVIEMSNLEISREVAHVILVLCVPVALIGMFLVLLPEGALRVAHGGNSLPKRATRDTPFVEAFAFGVTKQWGKGLDDAVASDCPDLSDPLQKFRQFALDGHLEVWGKPGGNGLYEPIHKRFWKDHTISWFPLVEGVVRTECTNLNHCAEVYADLMVNKAQVEYLWGRAISR
jgi:hypothetical protein